MTPYAALRELDVLVGSSDLPSGPLGKAEECLRVLWDYVLLGVESD